MKVLETMAICFGLESISSLAISNIFVDSDCLEVVKLLNDKDVDISEVPSFITETKERGGELGVVAYSHVHAVKMSWLTVLLVKFKFLTLSCLRWV